MSLSSRNYPKKERKNGSYGGYEDLEVVSSRPQPIGYTYRPDQHQDDTSALSALQNVQNEAAKLKEQVSRIGLRAGDAKNHESRANLLTRQLQEKEQENTILRSDKNEAQGNRETLDREKGVLLREKKQLEDGKEKAERDIATLQAEKKRLQDGKEKAERDNATLQAEKKRLQDGKEKAERDSATLQAEKKRLQDGKEKAEGENATLQAEKNQLKQKADQENKSLRLEITRLEAEVKEGDTKLQKQIEEERKLRDETKKLVQEMHALFATLKSSNDYISELQL